MTCTDKLIYKKDMWDTFIEEFSKIASYINSSKKPILYRTEITMNGNNLSYFSFHCQNLF